ncbi:hypothetical protein BDZ85DRAFT_261320 [Elsinoe ampelina]|uniref:Uncharacterized protein n=1 Tax=Elsinoe ampelina TaxID=302913 RepID=A0A6A6GC33_9PEZI|nr:hypothetical protein BDZ85DRAFT_261320 [Elsinoe ampelina]
MQVRGPLGAVWNANDTPGSCAGCVALHGASVGLGALAGAGGARWLILHGAFQVLARRASLEEHAVVLAWRFS